MSESKHTPGSWSAFYKHKYDEWHVSIPFPPNNMKLALFRDGVPGDDPESVAHLIAAAPDLLEALILLEREMVLSGNAGSQDYGWKPAIEKTRAAIAKAEGRT